MTVRVEWPDTHGLRDMPALFASREIAVRWMVAAATRGMDYGPDLDWRRCEPMTWTHDPDGVYTFRRVIHIADQIPAFVQATLPDGTTARVQHGHTNGPWSTSTRTLIVYVSPYNPKIVDEETPYPESWK